MPLSNEMKELLRQKGVMGISDPPNFIRVYVETPEDLLKLPQEISVAGISHAIEPIVSGRFFALQDRKAKWRPSPGGVSCGHFSITAGTLGSRVIDKITKKRLILSNNHVLAAGNQGQIGDKVYQPGKYDGGSDADTIALLERFVKLKQPPEENLVDAACALPLNDSDLSDEILEIGSVNKMTTSFAGQSVIKSGRTSGLTNAIVQDTNATIKVYGYPFPEEYALFKDQIITSVLGQPGDSGSLVIETATKNAIGLLFAGSDSLTAINKITNVSDLLDLDFPRAVYKASISPILFAFLIGAGINLLMPKI